MKLRVRLGLLIVALAVAYLLGTENGRNQRNAILAKLGRGPQPGSDSSVADAA